MGQQQRVRAVRRLEDALAALATEGLVCQVLMVDGALAAPTAPLPATWREVRLRTPAGMVTLQQEGDVITLVVFGNADAATLAVRDRLAGALGGA